MQNRLWIVMLSLVIPIPGMAQDHAGHSEHAGKQDREIKALPAEEVRALLDGEGAGYALAAELNRYPGPRHVLDLKDELALSSAQEREVLRIFEGMNASARTLGARLVEVERELDRAFRDRAVTPEGVRMLTRSAGEIEAEIRYVHLRAHLETTALLTHEQIRRYDQERGYGQAGGQAHQHEHP